MAIEDFEELKIDEFCNITTLGWTPPILTADFGAGYSAGAITAPYGLHRWTLNSTLLPDLDEYSIIHEVDGDEFTKSRFAYFFDFIKRHILRGNKPFLILDPRTGKKFLVAFADVAAGANFEQITAKIFIGGITLIERRAAGLLFDTDGSILEPPPVTIRLNCGGLVSGIWAEDAFFDSGSSYNSGSVWATPLLPGRGASNDVYQKLRYKSGTIKYTFTGLAKNEDVLVRVHYGDQGFGFVQSINANGVEKVASYTLQTDAGGSTKIGIKEFTAAADGDGELVLDFIGGTSSAMSAIEVLQPVPNPYNMIHTCGDSTTAGGGPISETEAWFNQLAILLDGNAARLNNNSGNDFIGTYDETKKWTVHLMARSGDPIETQESLMVTYANPYLYADLLDKSIMFLSCGINNVLAGDSAATIQTKLTSFFAAVDSGFTTGIGTITPTTGIYALSSGQETIRQAVNTWIRANSLGLDFIVDWEADSRLSTPSNGTYYYDGLHNTEAGHIVRAEIMRDAINAL